MMVLYGNYLVEYRAQMPRLAMFHMKKARHKMIAKMENGGGIIEVTPPPDKLYPKHCPWALPETCKHCPLNKDCKDRK